MDGRGTFLQTVYAWPDSEGNGTGSRAGIAGKLPDDRRAGVEYIYEADRMRKKNIARNEEICRLYRAGRTREQIAEEAYCSISTVDRVLRLSGDIKQRDSFEDHKETVMELYRAGSAQKEIAEKTGLSEQTISRNLRQMGMKRGKGWKAEPGKRGPRLPISHRERREYAGELELPIPRQYADNTKRAAKVEIRGKIYWDVSAWYM